MLNFDDFCIRNGNYPTTAVTPLVCYYAEFSVLGVFIIRLVAYIKYDKDFGLWRAVLRHVMV